MCGDTAGHHFLPFVQYRINVTSKNLYVLEEINGINQMYGRKMIIITNNLDKIKKIHNGAFIRPGRIDLLIHLKKCTKKDIINIIKNFFPDEFRDNKKIFEKYKKYTANIIDYKWTAASVVNFCKLSNSIEDVLFKIKN